MFCSNCGSELKDDANFCSKCGAAVAEDVICVVDTKLVANADTENFFDRTKKMSAKVSRKLKGILSSERIKFILKNKMFIIAIIYQLFPIDLISDALPVIGTLDDLMVILLGVCNVLDAYASGDNLKAVEGVVNIVQDVKNDDLISKV